MLSKSKYTLYFLASCYLILWKILQKAEREVKVAIQFQPFKTLI